MSIFSRANAIKKDIKEKREDWAEKKALSRDVKILEMQGYLLENAAPFDAFCQTMHCESVAKLVRAGS